MKKICNKCNKEKDISNFYVDMQKLDGHEYMCIECKKEYITNFKKRISKNKKLYSIKNKDKIKQKNKEYYQKNREKMLIQTYTKNDKKKKLYCDLTIEWMKENITSKSCIYCGDIENIGCDRIDNSKGHTINNVVPCCPICNRVRLDIFSTEEMHYLGLIIRQIKEKRKK